MHNDPPVNKKFMTKVKFAVIGLTINKKLTKILNYNYDCKMKDL